VTECQLLSSERFWVDHILKHLSIRKLPEAKHSVQNSSILQIEGSVARKLVIKQWRLSDVPEYSDLLNHIRNDQSTQRQHWNDRNSESIHHSQASDIHHERVLGEERDLSTVVDITVFQRRI